MLILGSLFNHRGNGTNQKRSDTQNNVLAHYFQESFTARSLLTNFITSEKMHKLESYITVTELNSAINQCRYL